MHYIYNHKTMARRFYSLCYKLLLSYFMRNSKTGREKNGRKKKFQDLLKD